MFTNEYTSAAEGGDGGGEGEEGGEGESFARRLEVKEEDVVDEGVSEMNVMLVVSLASSYRWMTAGRRFSSCCWRSLSMSLATLCPFFCMIRSIFILFSSFLCVLNGHFLSGRDSRQRLLKVEAGMPSWRAAFPCFIFISSDGTTRFRFKLSRLSDFLVGGRNDGR